jgi:hypothetical protein
MIREATSRLKVNEPLGVMPVLQFCTPAQLQIDQAYQRSLETGPSQTLIRRIAQFWNWDLCQPLVVARRADGGLYVVDGQHRLAAAVLRRDIAQLPCVITSYRNPADEASSFVALNQQRRPLGALDLFKAALVAEDETALAVVAILTRHGLSLAPHMTAVAWKPGQVANIGGIIRAYNILGPARAGCAIGVLAESFRGQVLRYAGTILPGIIDALTSGADPALLTPALRQRGQEKLRADILRRRAANPNERFQVAAGHVIRAVLGGAAPVAPMREITPSERREPAVADLTEVAKRWCEQCDRNVSDKAANFCVSRFCSLRRKA